jgi:HD-GYP domain-containing protein (c-di-GMP phosphodiesterase class II)
VKANLASVPRGLRSIGGRGLTLLVALLVTPAIVLGAARSFPALDPIYESVRFHLFVVSAIAACALLVALATAAFAARDGRSGPVLLSIGCVTVGFLLLGHGLTTPGIFGRPVNLWVARLAVLALVGFALCLALALREGGAIGRAPRATMAIPTLALLLFTSAVVVDPTALHGRAPLPGESVIRLVLLGAAALVLLVVGAVHWRRWGLGRDRIELALVLASWLTMAALLSLQFGTFWRLSWWDYHLYLLAGFAAAAWAVVAGFRRSRTLVGAVGGVTIRDPLEQVSQRHPEALGALIGAVEAKDPYTHGHSERVAELSARIGLRLALSPETMRGLHQGAFLHDVGKISVPDAVLNKAGDLTPQEWAMIERHPAVGWDLVSRAESLHGALSAIRHHHERWDGTGYPDRLAGTDIPHQGRIVAVADVWDALTSDRAYRPAWEVDRAVSHIAAASGTLFDPEAVDAFLDVVAERGLWPDKTRADLAALVEAAAGCHVEDRRRPSGATRQEPERPDATERSGVQASPRPSA